jgi:hypothetical protein
VREDTDDERTDEQVLSAERHGCELDMQGTGPVIARHHLVF